MSDKLEEIKAREAKAAKPPWRRGDAGDLCGPGENDQIMSDFWIDEADGDFIISARNNMPWLLKLVDAAKAYIESDIAYDIAVRHAEYLDAAAARDAREKALERWVAAKGET